MQKMKCFALLLSVLMLLASGLALAEETTLIYSYGEDARIKHMLEVPNIVKYKDEEWTFDMGNVSFDGTFSMYGGNTRTVWECEVPKASRAAAGDMYLGQVIIQVPGAMTLYAFSGDRGSGQYTLVDAQTNISGYTLDIYATRDANGTLRLTDRVFLYTYEEDGVKKNFAASVYISFEGYTAAAADTAPVTAVVSPAAPAAEAPTQTETGTDTATYEAMIRILDEERNRLTEQVAALQAENAALKTNPAADATLQAQITTLTEQLATKDAEISGLKTQNEALLLENAQLSATVDALNTQLSAALSATAAPTQAHTQTPTPVVTQAPTPVVTQAPTQAPTPVVTSTPIPTPVVTATPEATATPAPIEITFKKGQEVEIFNQNGVKIKFTGEVEDKGMSTLNLNVLVENLTSTPVRIDYTGSCNGWSLPHSVISGNAVYITPNTKAQGYLWFSYDDLNISKFSDMTNGYLAFTVKNADSYTELFKVPNVHIIFGTGEPEEIIPTYFEYYPELPDPTAYGAMYESSRSGPTLINGIPSSNVTYKYRSSRPDELAAAFDVYIGALKDMGFSVSRSGTLYTISHKGKNIATASCSDIIKIEILPAAIVVEKEDNEAALDVVKKNLGDTLSTSYMSFKAEKTGKTDIIYSFEGREPSYYFYYEPQPGSTFVYVKGTFKNKTNAEIDIRNIYTNLLVNGEINYKGTVCALRADGQNFINYVSAQDTVVCYVYFEVPDSVAGSMKTGTVRLGFTSTFNTKISQAGSGTYDFTRCEDVFDVNLQKTSSSSSKSTAANTSTRNNTQSSTQNAAQQTTESTEPITFQDIAWGSSVDTARNALVKAGYIKSKSAMYGEAGASSSMLTTGDEKSPYELPFGYEKVLYEDWIYSDVQKKVGGYDVSSISMLYTYGMKNNKLDKNTKELISVNVELSAADTAAALTDLKAKLESLYGPCVYSGFSGTVWLGKDNTCVILYDFAAPTLLYGKWNNLAQVQQMYKTLGYAPDTEDASGL